MNSPTIKTIEEEIRGLSLHDKLWLIEILARGIQDDTQAVDGLSANGGHKATNGHAEDGNSQSPVSWSEHSIDRAIDSPSPKSSSLWADKAMLKAAMKRFMEDAAIVEVAPIGPTALQEMIRREERMVSNELSRGIIEMREEKLRDRGHP